MKVAMAAVLVASFALSACRTGGDYPVADVKQLKDQLSSFKCPANQERLAMVQEKYGAKILGANAAWRANVFAVLSVLPDEYLEWVFKKHNVSVSLWSSGGGLTTLVISGGNPPDRPAYPTKIQISAGQPHYFPMQHEFGHAIQPQLDETHKTFYQSFKKWFNEAAKGNHQEAAHMWSYPKSDSSEYWAELFDTYYCSAEARLHMRDTYPRSYQFARRYLIDPSNLTASHTSTPAWRAENERDGDEDGDGVINKEDQCIATEAGQTIHMDGAYKGCAGGQHPDSINKFLGN